MTVPRILRLRWSAGRVPVTGCRWCGHLDVHPRWVPGRGLHEWEMPTEAQRLARHIVRRRHQG